MRLAQFKFQRKWKDYLVFRLILGKAEMTVYRPRHPYWLTWKFGCGYTHTHAYTYVQVYTHVYTRIVYDWSVELILGRKYKTKNHRKTLFSIIPYTQKKLVDLLKKHGFTIKKKRSRGYLSVIMINADYVDDLELLANAPVQAKSLLHNQEQTAEGLVSTWTEAK